MSRSAFLSSRRACRVLPLAVFTLGVSAPASAETAAPAAPEASPAPAAAPVDDEKTALARELGASGIELYESGAYPEANAQLERAYEFVKVPTTGLWSARSLDKVGRLLDAAARYREVVAMPVQPGEPIVFVEARRSAQQELDLMLPRIPKLVVKLSGATANEVRVSIDDTLLLPEQIDTEVSVDPGERKIVGVRGERAERVTLALPERSTGTAVLDFSPIVPPPVLTEQSTPVTEKDSGIDRKTWGYIALGVGGASLVTGVVTTVIASGKRSDLEENCPNERCTPDFHSDVDSLDSTLTVSLIAYLGAAAGIGVGTYLLLSGDEPPESGGAGVSVWLGPAAAGVNGRF